MWELDAQQKLAREQKEAEEKNVLPLRELKTPMSAGYLQKKTFFPNFPRNRLLLKRSESDRNLPPTRTEKSNTFNSNSGEIKINLHDDILVNGS